MAETRVVGGIVVTMDPQNSVHHDGEVAFDATGTITYVGPRRGPGGDLDVSGDLVIPGLVNAHAHSAMTPLRGYSDSKDLAAWLADMREFEVLMTAEDMTWALRLALVEMIRSGTTTFSDMFRWNRQLLGEVVDSGLRVVAAPAVFTAEAVGFPAAGPEDGRATLDITEELAREFAGDRQVRITFGPHAPYTCPPELLREVAQRAAAAGIGIQIHLSEDAKELERSLASTGRTPIRYVHDLGLFEVPVHVAHAVKATAEDIDILVRSGASVAHNPVSNLKLGSGVAPVPEMLAAGLTLALGTDGVASNNNLDMFEEIKTAVILHNGVREQTGSLAVTEVLAMATRSGARAVGLPETGQLVEGAWADLVVVRTDSPRGTPLHSPESFLGFAAQGQDVRHVVVGGRQLLRDGVVTSLDEAEVRHEVARTTGRIMAQLRGE